MVGTETTYQINGIESLETVAEKINSKYEARRMESQDDKVMCLVGGDEWKQDWDRKPLAVFEDGKLVNATAVSKDERFYTPVQFSEPFLALRPALEDRGIEPRGHITVGKYRKRLTSQINFDSVSITDPTGSEVDLGIKISTAHNGFKAVSIDVGAERLVCSNGMTAWESELSYTHAHDDGRFRADMMHRAVDAITDSTDTVQDRLNEAHQQELKNKQEAFLLLLDCGIEWIFQNPMETLEDAFSEEMKYRDQPEQMEQNPSLYDAYQVGTYAIDHLTDDQSQEAIDNARTRLTRLLEEYDGSVPNSKELVTQTVESRTNALSSGEDERWKGEQDLVQQVASTV
jgi:hypothetical protein